MASFLLEQRERGIKRLKLTARLKEVENQQGKVIKVAKYYAVSE